MAHDVFISYSTQNRNIAEALCASLEQERIRCWIAPRDIVPGTSWASALVSAIGGSRLVVVVLSKHSNISPYAIEEVGIAKKNRTPILPFRIENILPTGDMEFFLGSVQWLDALPPPAEAHLPRLTSTVVALLARTAGDVPAGQAVKSLSAPGDQPLQSLSESEKESAVAPSASRAERAPATLSTYLKGLRDDCGRNFSSELMRPDRMYVPQYAARFSCPEEEINLSVVSSEFWDGRAGCIMLLGNYGMGKSYFAWRTTLKQAERCEREREQRIPILYPLKKFNYGAAMEAGNNRRDIVDQVLDHARLLDFPRMERKQFKRLLEDGVVQLVLDGLDELSLPHRKQWREVLEPLSEIDGLCFAVTSRPAYLRQPQKELEGYSVYELLPWGEREWHLYLDYSRETLSATVGKDALLASIAARPKLASLTTRPLWCYMIVSIAGEIPRLHDLALGGLYQQFLNTAVKRRPASDSILPLPWQYYAMERFAEECVRNDESSLPEPRLLNLLSRLFESVGFQELRDYLISQFRTYAFLNCDQQRRYNFGHKSFEDYFTATGTARWLAEQATTQSLGPPQIQPREPLISRRRLSEVQLSFLVGVLQEPWVQESLGMTPQPGGQGLQTRVLLFLQRELIDEHSPAMLRLNLFRAYLAMLRAEGGEARPLLNGLCLKGANLAGMDLANCAFQRVDFTDAILSGARLARSSFAGCVFFGAMIDGADFTGADLTDADFRGVELPGQAPNFSQVTGVDRVKMRARERRPLFGD